MRSVWSTLASIVVLAGLAGYIFLVENKREPNASEVKEKVWDPIASVVVERRPAAGNRRDRGRLEWPRLWPGYA